MTYDPVQGARHIESFLNDRILQEIFRERKLLYFEQWLRSNDPSERERIFAETRAFDSLGVALQAVVDAGLHEQIQPALERRSQ